MACSNCGSHENDCFRMMSLEFDVAAANELITSERPVRVVPQSFLRGSGLPLEKEKCLNCRAEVSECSCGHTEYHISMVYINEQHLDHIQEPERPGIIATVFWAKPGGGRKYSAILIDGNHRAVRAFREGREFKAIMLTPTETWKIMSGFTKCAVNPSTKKGKAILVELGWSE
jgi:hypothetical protein